jgi:hypothetical protein
MVPIQMAGCSFWPESRWLLSFLLVIFSVVCMAVCLPAYGCYLACGCPPVWLPGCLSTCPIAHGCYPVDVRLSNVCVDFYQSDCLAVCLDICLAVCLQPAWLSVSLSACL